MNEKSNHNPGKKSLFLKFTFLLLSFPLYSMSQTLFQYVDPLIGTAPATTESAKRHSEAGSELKGQVYPAVGRPFGMTQWTPETRTTEAKCIVPYYYNDQYLTGFRGSHWMDGSCTQDYGTATVMPFSTGKIDTVRSCPTALLDHQKEKATPAYYSISLPDVKAEVTGSVRSGFLRFSYNQDKNNYIYIRVNSDKGEGKIWFDPQNNKIIGCNPVHRIYQGWGQPAGFCGWFVFRFDKPFSFIQKNNQEIIVCFQQEKTVQVQVGTSFTCAGAAGNNLDAEMPDWNFDQLKKEGENEWDEKLSKIQVKGGTKADHVKLYTALYHCYLVPRIASDVDGSYQGFAQDTLIHKAAGFDYYDDFSMWDTYRTLHPLMTILEPKRSLDMVKSLILKAEQGGWMPIFPKWANYTAAMIGDHACTMIADAYMRGIKDFDTEKAYQYMRKNAFDHPTEAEYKDGKGRRALTSYLKYGYIPLEDKVPEAFHKQEQVSRTLEYALDDYALAQFAKSLGKNDDYQMLMKRSQNYRNVFDTQTRYVRGRYIDGSWAEPFDPNVKSRFITEGTAFQYTWYVPQDIPGLISLFGGKEQFLKRLNEFFDKGYYWHGNETDQQAPYLFAMAGVPEKTQEWVRKIIEDEYGTGPGGLSGNEDGGQMSAWMVSSMLGFYPVCPGKPEYVIGGPFFEEVKIQISSDAKPFIIKARSAVSETPFVDEIILNGRPLDGYTIQQQQIVNGGKLIFRMQKP
jgi:putative alpha-1,2-mannosidase